MRQTITDVTTRIRWALLGGILIAAASGLVFSLVADGKDAPQHPKVEVVVDDTPIDRDGTQMYSYAPVIEKVSPAVVNIFTRTSGRTIQGQAMPENLPPFFRDFFGRGGREMRMPDQRGLGSGVIISEDGYILTNHHVVHGADDIQVSLNPDGRKFEAEVIGTDPKSEVAVLKIDAGGLSYVKLADSDKIQIGDVTLAIGNPFGIGQTVTMGIISATSRSVMGPEVLDYEDFIQTDAAINPGNSGGALVDAYGRLIGINTAILSRSGGNNGIGFAIPVNLARNIMENLIEHGRVVRGLLGVHIQDVTQELARAFDLERADGALVAEVNPGSAAEKAGLRDGDVIMEFNGTPIRNSQDLKNKVGMTPPGREVELRINRNGNSKTVVAELQERDAEPRLAGGNRSVDGDDEGALNGVAVDDLTSDVRSRLNIPAEFKGALIVQVDRDSPAYEQGLREGMVILEINRQHVENAKDAVDISRAVENKVVLLKVWSDGFSRYLVVDESDVG